MLQKLSLQRLALYGLIAGLVLSALVGIWVFVFGNFGDTEIKILLTTLSVAGFSVMALGCAAAQQLGRSRLLWLPGLAASSVGLVIFILGIWLEWYQHASFGKTMAIVAILAFSFAQACLLAMPRLSTKVRWVFIGALVSIFALALIISGMIAIGVHDEWLFRLAGVLGVLDGCATLTIPILYKLGYRAPPPEAEPNQTNLQIKLACPRCGHEEQYALGIIRCTQCGLGLRVEVIDEPGYPTGRTTARPQYRLRTLLILFLIASVFLGWLGARLQYLRRQNAVIQRLQRADVVVGYSYGNVDSLYRGSGSPGRLAPDDLTGIEELSSLAVVRFEDGQMTDEHLRHLAGLRDLRVLRVSGRGVTNVGLGYIGGLEELQEVYLSGAQITDEGLAQLVGLRKLVDLEIENSPISDSAVRHLVEMSSLRMITLSGTKMTEAGIARLEQAMPKTTVIGTAAGKPGSKKSGQ